MRQYDDYPKCIEDILDDSMTFDERLVACVSRFALSKPWSGPLSPRRDKFRQLHVELAAAVGISPPRLIFAGTADADSTRSCYISSVDTIVMRGPLSVTTMLHEWAHRIHGPSEFQACRWSINLFRLCFPRSFANALHDGHLLRRKRANTSAADRSDLG